MGEASNTSDASREEGPVLIPVLMPGTPGPWEVHCDSRGRGYEINARPADSLRAREVCRINSRRIGARRGCAVQFRQHPEDLANATLIAKLPDMIAASREALALVLAHLDGLCDGESDVMQRAYWQRVAGLLERATGAAS